MKVKEVVQNELFTFMVQYTIIKLYISSNNIICINAYPLDNCYYYRRNQRTKGWDIMKLIYVIVRNVDSGRVTDALNKNGFYVTKLASTGGFLREGNTTLMIGTEEEKVDEVIDLVKKECGPRQQIVSNPVGPAEFSSMQVMVNVGGAIIFVTDVDRFERI